MATENITLKTRDKREVTATAEVHRILPATRVGQLVGCAVLGVVCGLATLPIPGVHFVGPWALPLGGLVVGGYLYGRTGTVSDVVATCPGCDAEFAAEGGSLGNDQVWVRCGTAGCDTPMQVVVEG
jgi:hypothetical protein